MFLLFLSFEHSIFVFVSCFDIHRYIMSKAVIHAGKSESCHLRIAFSTLQPFLFCLPLKAYGLQLITYSLQPLIIITRYPLPVFTTLHPLDPGIVVKIPLNGFLNACFKGFQWLPQEFGFQFGTIDGIAKIMSGSVIHERDQF